MPASRAADAGRRTSAARSPRRRSTGRLGRRRSPSSAAGRWRRRKARHGRSTRRSSRRSAAASAGSVPPSPLPLRSRSLDVVPRSSSGLDGRRRHEERVGARRPLDLEPVAGEQRDEVAAREAPTGVGDAVVGPPQAAHAGLPEAQQAAGLDAPAPSRRPPPPVTRSIGGTASSRTARRRTTRRRTAAPRRRMATTRLVGVALTVQRRARAARSRRRRAAPASPATLRSHRCRTRRRGSGRRRQPVSRAAPASSARVDRYHQWVSSTSAMRRYSASSMTGVTIRRHDQVPRGIVAIRRTAER